MTSIYRDARAQTIILKMDVGGHMREQLPPPRETAAPGLASLSLPSHAHPPEIPAPPPASLQVPAWDTINGLSPHRERSENKVGSACVSVSVREREREKTRINTSSKE